MSGKVESPSTANDTVYESNLRYAVERFQSEGIIGVIEPINSITVPNYYMHSFEKGLYNKHMGIKKKEKKTFLRI